MAKLLFFYVLACLSLLITCSATTYMVGDTAGWDLSTDLDSWVKNKTFNVGDVLVFQYSSAYTVNEVTRNNFNGCNVNQPLQTYTGGNSNITLTKPGDRFFVSGNKLYCLGGMKLQVHVNGGQVAASAPGLAPQASTSLPPSSTNKNNYKSSPNNFSSSNGSPYPGRDSLVAAFLAAVLTLLSVAII
ncbi:hypothetical protein NE237_026844 [Protea cynaroides]|uniref:Phytocyanin domain-containing protein n=1 Tax=Protea cynaroides TaxID=273540 RepID=A0A9Q0JSM5_9MAGN|nr:hypothetical protein NE237_026844 [Protea cynaroides]